MSAYRAPWPTKPVKTQARAKTELFSSINYSSFSIMEYSNRNSKFLKFAEGISSCFRSKMLISKKKNKLENVQPRAHETP